MESLAYCALEQLCAIANRDLRLITEKQGNAIIEACDEIIAGKLHDQFIVDMRHRAGTNVAVNDPDIGKFGADLFDEVAGQLPGNGVPARAAIQYKKCFHRYILFQSMARTCAAGVGENI